MFTDMGGDYDTTIYTNVTKKMINKIILNNLKHLKALLKQIKYSAIYLVLKSSIVTSVFTDKCVHRQMCVHRHVYSQTSVFTDKCVHRQMFSKTSVFTDMCVH